MHVMNRLTQCMPCINLTKPTDIQFLAYETVSSLTLKSQKWTVSTDVGQWAD